MYVIHSTYIYNDDYIYYFSHPSSITTHYCTVLSKTQSLQYHLPEGEHIYFSFKTQTG